MSRVYKPEFVTLAPPLMNCQDEVKINNKKLILVEIFMSMFSTQTSLL